MSTTRFAWPLRELEQRLMGAEQELARERFFGVEEVFLTDDQKIQVREHKLAPPKWIGVNDIFKYPFLSINQVSYAVLHIDVDNPDCDRDPIIPPAFDVSFYDWLDIPPPNFTVQTTPPRFHAFWLLQKFMPFSASQKAVAFYHDVRTKLNFALGGDASCNIRGASRNPFYIEAQPNVRCFSKQRRSLHEINPRHIRIPARTYKNQAHRYREGNRNQTTFRVVLRRYKELGQDASSQELYEYARRFQEQCDAEPLPDSENWSIACSIARNGHRYKVSADRNYGAMGLPDVSWDEMSADERAAEIQRRKSKGAYWTHDRRKDKTKIRLQLAIEELEREGIPTSQRRVAARSGYSLRTVKSWWKYLGWCNLVNR